jgi:uncharacterized phage infection (PIP) family protein YhgE
MNSRVPQVAADIEDRHAAAFSEIKQMHIDFKAMQADLIAAQRELDKRQNLIELLTAEKDRLNDLSQVYMRKLVRLAAAMSGISRLAQDADEIMRSVQEFKEVEGERSLGDIYDNLPASAKTDGGQQ